MHEMAVWASLVASQVLNCILSHSLPLHSQMWWSCILLTSPTTSKLAALTVQFNLCLCCLFYRPPTASIPSQTRDACWLFLLGSSPWDEGVLLVGTTLSLVQRSTTSLLWCSTATPFHLQKFSIFIKPDYLLQNVKLLWRADKSLRSAVVMVGDGNLPPMHTAPQHHPSSVSDSGSAQKHWRWSVSGTYVSCGH